jgi:deoxyadenosine/deoxycytidine kinase
MDNNRRIPMKRLLQRFFNRIEKIYRKKNNWTLIPNTEYGFVYIDRFEYKGKDKLLSDGTVITKGDLVAEMHINNKEVKEGSFKMVFKIFNSEFKAMAEAVSNDNEYSQIKAIFGRTVLYPITKKMGFEVFDIEKKSLKIFLKIWDNLIKLVFSKSKKGKFIVREPKEIWISKEKLISCVK